MHSLDGDEVWVDGALVARVAVDVQELDVSPVDAFTNEPVGALRVSCVYLGMDDRRAESRLTDFVSGIARARLGRLTSAAVVAFVGDEDLVFSAVAFGLYKKNVCSSLYYHEQGAKLVLSCDRVEIERADVKCTVCAPGYLERAKQAVSLLMTS